MKKFLFFVAIATFPILGIAQNVTYWNPYLPEDERITSFLKELTVDEKVACFSTRPNLPRLGIRPTRFTEGLHGYAHSGPANWGVVGPGRSATTCWPQAIGLAETWDPALIQKVASLQADEHRYLFQSPKYNYSGGIIVLAPNADLARDPRWGRTEESFGEDPYLVSRMTVAYAKGLQGDHPKYWKTASLMKHFLANSNENNRAFNSSNFDERLFREYYAYGFYKGVIEGGSRAYMAAYNAHNGIPAHVHPVLKNVTVNEWGQNGIICTDGGGLGLLVTGHKYFPNLETATAACIKAGINVFLDGIHAQYIRKALDEKLITEADMDEVLRGVIRVWIRLGLLDFSPDNPYSSIGVTDKTDPWNKPEVHNFVREVTAKSVVLLKNDKNLLPISNKVKKIAVLGPRANEVISDWYGGAPPYAVSAVEGIRNAFGNNVEITFAKTNKADSAVILAKEADMAIVCVGNHPLSYGLGWGVNHVPSDGREDVDREALSLEQEDLVKLVYAANPNTVMALISSFPYTINWSVANLPAIVHITQSSQELGNGLADVLTGKVNPAGRLVQAWPASIGDLLPILEYDIRKGKTYMYMKQKPLFPFGFGLSYTAFKYSNLKIEQSRISAGQTVNVSVDITNTGNYDGEEVVQLYASFPDSKVSRPVIALKGFERVAVKKGATVTVVMPLDANELAYWNENRHEFVLEQGRVQLLVGASSADIRLQAIIVCN
jgi:beta-glucosidase